jgi:Tol biopolymer transport system component
LDRKVTFLLLLLSALVFDQLVLGLTALGQNIADSFQFPLSQYEISGFNFGKPVLCGNLRLHLGEDVGAEVLVPVRAIANGKVIFSGTKGDPTQFDQNYGHAVVLEHTLTDGSKIVSLYGHLKLAGLIAGDIQFTKVDQIITVNKGEIIGYIGSYYENGGWSPHLHLEIRKGGATTDPKKSYYTWSYFGYSRYLKDCSATGEDIDANGGQFINPSVFLANNGASLELTLIRAKNTTPVYWVQNGKKYHVTDPKILTLMTGMFGWRSQYILEVPSSYVSRFTARPELVAPIPSQKVPCPDQSNTCSDGVLIQKTGDSKVYYVMQNGKRRLIATLDIFTCRGYDLNDVLTITSTMMNAIDLGVDITKCPETNSSPVANAGPDQIVRPGRPILLNGKDSTDPDCGKCIKSWQWTIVSDANPAQCRFTSSNSLVVTLNVSTVAVIPQRLGSCLVRLIVNDGVLDSPPDPMVIISTNPPRTPSSPKPFNGETKVSLTPTLSWVGGDPDGDPVTYDIYFDTALPLSHQNSLADKSNPSATTFQPAGPLAGNTLYFWQIVAKDKNGSKTEGPIWQFRTLVDCTLDISPTTSPILPPTGGIGSFDVKTGPTCSWKVSSKPDWVKITAGAQGTSNGTVKYSVTTPSPTQRTGNIIVIGINSKTYVVTQLGTNNPPPSLINDFQASDNESTQSTLSWTNPSDNDLAEVTVHRKSDAFPSTHSDGTEVSACHQTSPTSSKTSTCIDQGLTNGTTYYYAVFSRNVGGDWNDQVVEGKNADAGKPNQPGGAPKKIAFYSLRDGQGEIYLMDADGSNQINLTNNSASDADPAFSPDGSQIVFSSNRGCHAGTVGLFIMNIDGTNVKRLTGTTQAPDGSPFCEPEVDTYPSFSPDGTKIVFVSSLVPGGPPTQRNIFSIDVSAGSPSNLTQLTNGHWNDIRPVFTPDGTKIVFSTDRNSSFGSGINDIYIMDADGTSVTRLTDDPNDDDVPNVSPDGTKITFTSNRSGNYEIYTMNFDGTNVTDLTNNSADDGDSGFSSDGTKITFVSGRDGNFEVYVMNANGSNQTRLTNTSAMELEPRFQPQPLLTSNLATTIKNKVLDKIQVRHYANEASRAIGFIIDHPTIRDLKLSIFNLSGKPVYESNWLTGKTFLWRGQDSSGRRLANGVYLYVILVKTPEGRILRTEVKKLLVMR